MLIPAYAPNGTRVLVAPMLLDNPVLAAIYTLTPPVESKQARKALAKSIDPVIEIEEAE
jgi:hypothetical protein